MSVVLGRPHSLNTDIDTTGWKIVEITVLSHQTSKCAGKIRLETKTPPRDEEHPWDAVLKGGIWEIRGEGAIVNGNRIRSTTTYPFSTNQLVNKGVRDFITHWITGNKGKFVSAPAPAAATVAASAPAPKPAPPPKQPAAVVRPTVQTPPVAIAARAAQAEPSLAAPVKRREFVEVLVSEVEPFKGQPRVEFTDEDLEEIRGSLEQEGQTQIIIVTPITGVPGKRWGLVDGERRYRGALAAGIKTLLAMVKTYANEKERFWDSFTMNWNRRGHTTFESIRDIAIAIADGKTIAEICIATSRSNCWVYQHYQLHQKLDPWLLDQLRISVPQAIRMPFSIANKLARIPDKTEQVRIWKIVREEKSRGLMKIKADELMEPQLEKLPKKGRVRKPSDNGRRILRIVRTAESDTRIIGRSNDADLKAFIAGLPQDATKDTIVAVITKVARDWVALASTLKAV